MRKRKSALTGYILALFLGGLGAHLFYLRKYVRGILYLLFSWTFIPILLGWIDMLFIKKWTRQLNERIDNENYQNNTLIQVENNNRELSISLEEIKSKTKKVKSVLKESLTFYNEDEIILPKYRHLKANKAILEHLKNAQESKIYDKNGLQISVSVSNHESEFIKDSLRYARTRGTETKEIPFLSYWPTFRSLNERQLKWYFYWREQVLKGNYLKVDLSYIFIFVYELLNYSFNQNAAFNVSMLIRLLNNYKEDYPELEKYLEVWIADMLYELGEVELAEEWDNSKREIVPKLYETISDNMDRLESISMNEWKPYIRNYRETTFFQKNKYKIYNKFKKAIPYIQKVYQEKGTTILDEWFEIREIRLVRTLYVNAVVDRVDRQIHVPTIEYRPKQRLYDVLSNLFRLSENVVRIEAGEKRLIKVDETVLPENIKEIMLDKYQRFKVVQTKEVKIKGSAIPSSPKTLDDNKNKLEESMASKEENYKEIEFDWDEIKQKEQELMRLQQKIDANETENEETEVISIETDKNNTTELERIEMEWQPIQSLSSLFNDSNEDLADLAKSLTNIEKQFLLLFEDNILSLEKAKAFTMEKGFMLGLFIIEINEKANEYIGDILLEEKVDIIEIVEDYQEIKSLIRGAESED